MGSNAAALVPPGAAIHGALRPFLDAGVLIAADVYVASRLASLAGEVDVGVVVAAALAVRAARHGSVCVDLGDLANVTAEQVDDEAAADLASLPWPEKSGVLAALRISPLTQASEQHPLAPLTLRETGDAALLYLDRYHRQEETIAQILDQRATARPPIVDAAALARKVTEYFPGPERDRQRVAAVAAVLNATTVIAGGPGTGKTYTVGRILALLIDQYGDGLRLALAAPTGRAAARLGEQVSEQAAKLDLPQRVRDRGLNPTTLHRLLGAKPGTSSRFRHNRSNHLPFDVVVVDETSMVSLTMMCRLLEALRPDARLILVGDPDQLASVDAGAVLADLVARPVMIPADDPAGDDERAGKEQTTSAWASVSRDLAARAATEHDDAPFTDAEAVAVRTGLVRLTRNRRSVGPIQVLAAAIRDGDDDTVVEVFRGGGGAARWVETTGIVSGADLPTVRADAVAAAGLVTAAAIAGDGASALAALARHRVLCAHRDGPTGASQWNRIAAQWISEGEAGVTDRHSDDVWYPGMPLLVTANDYDAGVYNGETGVVIRRDRELKVVFDRPGKALELYPQQLAAAQAVYAMTIHRSQGSEYDQVAVILPPADSRLLSRELLYTAVTRAREGVTVVGTEQSLRDGVTRAVVRASGLRAR